MTRCKNCRENIVDLGEEWTHQPEGASFQDGMHRYCHLSVAEPEEGLVTRHPFDVSRINDPEEV